MNTQIRIVAWCGVLAALVPLLPSARAIEAGALDDEATEISRGSFAAVPARFPVADGTERPGGSDPVGAADAIEVTAYNYGFDLWSVVEQLRAPTNSSLRVRFTVESPRARDAFLGLGCSDEFQLWQEGRVLEGYYSWREYVRAENLIPVHLHAGANEFTLVCRKAGGWDAIPRRHNDREWLLGLDVFDSAAQAVRKHLSRSPHLLAHPVIADWAALRLEAALPEVSPWEIYDVAGRRIGAGAPEAQRFTPDAVAAARRGPLWLRAGDTTEPFFLGTNDEAIAWARDALKRKPAEDVAADPWGARVAHLLRHLPEDPNDRWFFRKLVQSVFVREATRALLDDPDSLFAHFPGAALRFVTYRSQLDGTWQYARVSTSRALAGTPFAVMLPTVQDPVRPPLESTEHANLRGNLELVALAAAHRTRIVLPGYSETDFGGEFSQAELSEALGAVRAYTGEPETPGFLIGTCSAALAALRYAERHAVAGLALLSSSIERERPRHLPGMPVDDVVFPAAFPLRERRLDDEPRLARIPMYVQFSTAMPGHGDRAGTLALVERLRVLGGDVALELPSPNHEYTWGERDRVLTRAAFRWIAGQGRGSTEPAPAAAAALGDPRTIKSALCRGFAVESVADPVLSGWIQQWAATWAKIRGAAPVADGAAGRRAPCRISSRLLNDAELQAIAGHGFFPGRAWLDRVIATEEPPEFFGVRVRGGDGAEAGVEILRSVSATTELPRFELMNDGEMSGVLWQRIGGEWLQVGLWLDDRSPATLAATP